MRECSSARTFFCCVCRPSAYPSPWAVDRRLLGKHTTVSDDSIELFLPSRKNRDSESRLTRRCWCCSCKLTFPVHSLGAWWKQQEAGTRPFMGTSPGKALKVLRELLVEVEVPLAVMYRYVGLVLWGVPSALACALQDP